MLLWPYCTHQIFVSIADIYAQISMSSSRPSQLSSPLINHRDFLFSPPYKYLFYTIWALFYPSFRCEQIFTFHSHTTPENMKKL